MWYKILNVFFLYELFQGAKHLARAKAAQNVRPLFTAKTPSGDVESREKAQSSFQRADNIIRAELIFLLGSIKSHMSARGSQSILSLLPSMFEDSPIAKEISLGRTKYAYYLCYGVAPYLEKNLVNELQGVSEFVCMFDESLNKVSQRCQMDFILRYWSNEKHQVVTRYFNSAFLGHTRADDLLAAFCKVLEKIDLKSLISVSMDGPTVNWSFLQKLVSQRKQNSLPEILNVGSCGLHIVHGAVQTGHRESAWNLNEVFGAAYYLFKNSPVRRSGFHEITLSTVFPMKFCSVRWLENLSVAKRLLDLIPDLKKYCAQVHPKPCVISFNRIEKAINDPMLKARLGFFISVCTIVEPFLRRFQTSSPLIPFLYDALSDVQTALANR